MDPVFLEPLPRPHCRQTPPQGHRNGSREPHGRSNGFFYRLPFAKPQTLQTFQLLQKFAQLRREKAPHGRSNGFFSHTAGKRHHKATAMAQEHPTAAAMASFIGCRLRSLKPSKPSNSSKSLPNSAGKRHPTAAAMASFIGVQGCHLPGLKRSKRSKPSTSPPSSAGTRYPNKPNTRHSRMQNALLRRQTVPQQAQQAPRPQAKATTRPQQWLKGTPRPQQWLLIGVQGCRLTGLKRSKRSKPSKSPPSSAHSRMQNAQLRRQKVPQQAQQAPRRSKRSKPSKSRPSSAGKRYPNKPNTRHSRMQKPPQGHSNGSRAPPGRSNGKVWILSFLNPVVCSLPFACT